MEEIKKQENTQNLIDIFEIGAGLWKVFKNFRVIILAIICICGIVGGIYEKRTYHSQYEATASFIVSVAGGGDATSGYYNQVTMEQLNATFPYILTSGILNRVVANDLGVDVVPGTISASVLEETNLFQIRVVSSEAEQAYDILNSVIENYPAVAKYVIGDTTLKLIDESGVPSEPMSKPEYKKAVVKGMLGGCLISIGLLIFGVLFRNTVKNQDDIKKFLNIKYLSGIPQEQIKKRSRAASGGVMLDKMEVSYAFKESLSTLQIRMNRELKEKGIKTVMVTSTLAGEGKTTVVCNLAYAMAKKGYKVLLLDADFRNPSVASVLQLERKEKGIEDVLMGKAQPEEAICRYEESNLWVIPGIKAQEKVAKLYRNGHLQKLLEKYEGQMDVILVDTPPCGIMNDAVLAAEYVEGIMLVIRQDFARREQILEGVETLSGSPAVMVGCVINGEETGITGYNYGKYGYGKYGYGKYGYGKYGYGKYGEDTKEE